MNRIANRRPRRKKRSTMMLNAPSTIQNADEIDLKNKAENAAPSMVDRAKDAASSVAHSVGEAGSDVGEKAKRATSAVGGGMKSLAGTIRENAPHQGVLGTASSSVADTLDKGGRYLQEEGLSGIGGEVTNFIRRNPIPAVLVGIGVGFLLAKLTTRS
jgi:hypothetical protein